MKASLQDFITKIFTQIKNNFGNVDNTSDADKPISKAQQTAFDKVEKVCMGNLWTLENSYSGSAGFIIPFTDFSLPVGKYRLEYDVTSLSTIRTSEFGFAKTGASDKIKSISRTDALGHFEGIFELSETCYKVFFFSNSSGITISNLKLTLLELGSEVKKVNDSLSVIGKCKNLLNYTFDTTTLNGVTCTNNGDGTYTMNGTATANSYFYLEKGRLSTGIYKLVGCPSGGSSSSFELQTTDGTNTYRDFGDGILFNHSTGYNVVICARPGYTFNNIVFKPMIITKLDATYDDFVPYTGDGDTLTHDVAELKNDLGTLSIKTKTIAVTLSSSTFDLTPELMGMNAIEYVPLFFRIDKSDGRTIYVECGIYQNVQDRYTLKFKEADSYLSSGSFNLTVYYMTV